MRIAATLRTASVIQITFMKFFTSSRLKVTDSSGSSLTLRDNKQGLDVTIEGSSLQADPGSNSFSGSATGFSINKTGDTSKSVDVVLPTNTSMSALNGAADDIRGAPNPKNSAGFLNVLMPENSPFPDLFYIGSKGGEKALGFDGDDNFNMGRGNDTVYATAGADIIDGGAGRDTFDGSFYNGRLRINLEKDFARGAGINATLLGVENAIGTKKKDHMVGDIGANKLDGGKGNDYIYGGAGDDNLKGGGGKDVIDGGVGNDRLSGGAGEDTFVFHGPELGRDVITDFAADEDTLAFIFIEKSDIRVKLSGENTLVIHPGGKIVLEDVHLTKSEIDFDLL